MYVKANSNKFTESDMRKLFLLDNQLTKIALASGRKCSMQMVQRDPWSPKLKQKGKKIVYWYLKLALLQHFNATAPSLKQL